MNTFVVYGLSFFTCVVFGYALQHLRNYLRVNNLCFDVCAATVIALPIITIMSIRYGIGTDFFNYERIFNYYQHHAVSRMELGFSFLMDLVLCCSDEFQMFIFATSLLTVFLPVYVIFSKTKNYLWLQLLLLLCLYFGLWCNVIRQAVAIGFIAFAIHYLLKKRRKLFVFFVVFASLFHISAFGVLPLMLYTVGQKKISNNHKWVIVLAVITSLIFGFFYLNYGATFDILYSGYISSHREGGRLWIYFVLSFFLYFPEFFCLKEICRIEKMNVILYIMLVFEFLFFLLSIKVAHAYRMGFYFSLAHLYLIPLSLQVCSEKNTRFLLTLYYALFFIFYFYVTTSLFGLNGISQYSAYFSNL